MNGLNVSYNMSISNSMYQILTCWQKIQ
jgi:hypothetical protein